MIFNVLYELIKICSMTFICGRFSFVINLTISCILVVSFLFFYIIFFL